MWASARPGLIRWADTNLLPVEKTVPVGARPSRGRATVESLLYDLRVTIIQQLRDDAVDSSKSLADLLRRAIVLGSLLHNDELKHWAKRELDGYEHDSDVPEYRRATAHIYGHFVGAFGREVRNFRVPVNALKIDPRLQAFLSEEIRVGNGVAAIEEMLTSGADDTNTLKFSIPTEVCMFLPTVLEHMNCASLHKQTHKSSIRQILDAIRSRLLDIVLDLSEHFPDITESENAVQAVDRQAAASIIHNHIYGNSNVVASGSHIQQVVQQTFEPHDLDALLDIAGKLGLSGREREELRVALTQDGERKESKFGPKVAAWFGRTTQKLLESGFTAAPGLLTEAISRYYGWK